MISLYVEENTCVSMQNHEVHANMTTHIMQVEQPVLSEKPHRHDKATGIGGGGLATAHYGLCGGGFICLAGAPVLTPMVLCRDPLYALSIACCRMKRMW